MLSNLEMPRSHTVISHLLYSANSGGTRIDDILAPGGWVATGPSGWPEPAATLTEPLHARFLRWLVQYNLRSTPRATSGTPTPPYSANSGGSGLAANGLFIWDELTDIARPIYDSGEFFGRASDLPFDYLTSNETRFGWEAVTEQPHPQPLDTESLELTLYAAVEREPVLDGYVHSAEPTIEQVFAEHPEATQGWVSGLLAADNQADFTADVVRLVLRTIRGSIQWRLAIVANALSSPSASMREVGIQAVETWRDRELVQMLMRHAETVNWLAEYRRQVIEDLD